MHGKVTDLLTGKGIPNAIVDIWQASSNGKYDFQDPENQSDNNLRGKFRTDKNGDYHFYMYRPTAYSLPTDGPAGVLLTLLDRHPMRPAHIHLMVSLSTPMIYYPCTNCNHRSHKMNTSQLQPKSSQLTTHISLPIPCSQSRMISLWSSSQEKGTQMHNWIWSTTSFLHQSHIKVLQI